MWLFRMEHFLQHDFCQQTRISKWLQDFMWYFFLRLATLAKRTQPLGPGVPGLTLKLALSSLSLVQRGEREGWGLAFSPTSQTWGYKTHYHSFRLGIWKQRSPWAHHLRPEFPGFILSPISSVAAYTSAQVHGKWSVSVNDFFIYVRGRPIRQIQWDKFRDFVSCRHSRAWLCSGAQTRDRLVKMGSFSWKKFISMERNTWWVKNIKYWHFVLGAAQGAERAVCEAIKISQSLNPPSTGRGADNSPYPSWLGVLATSLLAVRKQSFLIYYF